jgi:methylenetetrahydrofolate reductase (NADPH)
MKPFRESIQSGKFVLTAELNLARESDAAIIVKEATALGQYVDAIQVPDSPNARIQPSPSAVSGILLANGIEPIARLTCRDRNRVALECELLSLGLAGVTSVLLLRGDELPDHYRPKLQQVFELGGKELIETAHALAEDPTVFTTPEFHIGTVATVFRPKSGWQPKSLISRVDAGAGFIQTQICFDIAALKRYMTHLVEARLTWRAAVIVSVATLPDVMTARWLRENVSGSVVPRKVIRRLEQASDPEAEGVAICAEMLQALQEVPGVSGANLMTPGDPDTIVSAIKSAALPG